MLVLLVVGEAESNTTLGIIISGMVDYETDGLF
jgi:hypothetical protein